MTTTRTEDTERMLTLQKMLQKNQLEANSHKSSWRLLRPAELLLRAEQEMEELRQAVRELMRAEERGSKALLPKMRGRVLHEATDVGNFCGFLVDNVAIEMPNFGLERRIAEADDNADLLAVAREHLRVARCGACGRLTRRDFKCVHCGAGAVEIDDEEGIGEW